MRVAFPKDVAAKPDFDPSYAVALWDLTNRRNWAASESMQRGPGRFAPDEDGSTSSSLGWPEPTPVPPVPLRNAVDAVDRPRVGTDREGDRRRNVIAAYHRSASRTCAGTLAD